MAELAYKMEIGISFIVPVYNEAKVIERCLESIFSHMKKTGFQYEVIVVDNLSTDETLEVLQKNNIEPLICDKKNNPAATRNLGAKNAKYNLLCFIDGDCLLSDGFAARIVEKFSDKKLGAYGGAVLSPAEGNWIETSWAPRQSTYYYVDNAVLAGANIATTRSVFNTLGGFDENLTTAEDDDYSRRVKQQGLRVIKDSLHSVVHLGYPKRLIDVVIKQRWHGSSQLKAHGLFGDKLIALTLIWILAWIALLLNIDAIRFVAVFIVLIAPMLLAIKRAAPFAEKNIALCLRLYIISFFVLVGRAFGMFSEIWNELTKRN